MNSKRNAFVGSIALVMTVGLAAVMPALAVEYIDINQYHQGGFLALASQLRGQSFIPHATNISAVSIYLDCYNNCVGTATVQILDEACGTVLAHGTGYGGPGWVKCDLVGVQALVPGRTYVIQMTATTDYIAGYMDIYPDGTAYHLCNPLPDSDFAFKTWADDEAVPSTETTWGSIKSLYR